MISCDSCGKDIEHDEVKPCMGSMFKRDGYCPDDYRFCKDCLEGSMCEWCAKKWAEESNGKEEKEIQGNGSFTVPLN